MRHSHLLTLRQRLMLVLVCLHMLAPALASAIDAWRLDGREAFAHFESPGGTGCVPVHRHDCAFCELSTSATGEAPRAPSACVAQRVVFRGTRSDQRVSAAQRRGSRSPRAPPAVS